MFASQIKSLFVVTQIAVLAAGSSAFAATGKVYIADEGASTVSVMDATSFKKIGSIPVGQGPHNVQVSPDGKWVWVTNNGDPAKVAETMPAEKMPKAEHGAMAGAGAVWVIDATTDAVVAKVPVGKHPAHVVVASDGRTAYITNGGDNTVSVVDTAAQRVVGVVAVGASPHGLRITPDGKWVWVTNNGDPAKAAETMPMPAEKMPKAEHGAMAGAGAVWVIDAATDAVVAKVPVGKHPAHVVVASDGRTAYITNGGDNTVSVVDTATQRVIGVAPVGVSPHGLRITPDGKQVWVANLKGDTVSVIDTVSRKQVAQIAAGKGPAQVGFTPDGRFGFVSLSGENKVAVIDPVSRKVIRKIAVGTVPIQLHATPDNRLVLVANQGTPKKPGTKVSVIDVASMRVAATIEAGAGAHGVVVDRDGRHAFVTNTYANTVSVIDVAERKVVATVPVGKGPNGISMAP